MIEIIIPEQGDHAKFWINDDWVRFTVEYGIYENFLVFLDHHDLSFVRTNYIDFDNEVPIQLHGFGYSYHLEDFLANNAGNESLICDFIEYYIMELDFRYYYYECPRLKLTFTCTGDWQTSTVMVTKSIPHYYLTVDSTMWRVDTTEITVDQIYV
jgi:hypothetical protein